MVILFFFFFQAEAGIRDLVRTRGLGDVNKSQKTLDAAFSKLLADVAKLLKDGDIIAIDGKALRGARDPGESARTRMMVSALSLLHI